MLESQSLMLLPILVVLWLQWWLVLKKRRSISIYLSVAELHRTSLSPFVSVNGALEHKVLMFLRHLVDKLFND